MAKGFQREPERGVAKRWCRGCEQMVWAGDFWAITDRQRPAQGQRYEVCRRCAAQEPRPTLSSSMWDEPPPDHRRKTIRERLDDQS